MPFKKVDCKEELNDFLNKNPECIETINQFDKEYESKKKEK